METRENYRERRRNSGNDRQKKRGRKELKSSEDVCFICLDGGDLVLCEHGSCPKAYHRHCVERDARYFLERGTWTCGWHLCSSCGNPAKFLCYTCETSYCRICLKEEEFVFIKKPRGFCGHCFKIVNMIEQNRDVDSDGNEVDFTDKGTYEFLFKDYWLELKDKHSLTLADLHKAQIPFKDDTDSDRTNEEDDISSVVSCTELEWADKEKFNMRNKRKQSNAKKSRCGRYEEMECQSGTKNTPLVKEFSGWASKELIELIAYIGEETKDPLSWLEVKNLLLKYITENKLDDPCKRNHILCDWRLFKLFGKNILRRCEMYKLLESHIMPKKENVRHEPHRMHVNTDDVEEDKEPIDVTMIMRRRELRKNVHEDNVLRAKPNDFAAINVHNIRLIYLQRDVLEDLLEDLGSFSEKVTASFVRIRITGTGNGEMSCHRLVQVVGTKKVQEAYITGRKVTDLILEILNLDKEEDIFINEASNQDFTEEECQQLHQSVKCGLIKQPTVGEIQKIAEALHEVKVNNWLETEITKLSNLRDRASEKGCRKDTLRECVEKIQLLSSPEERARKLHELPEVIAGPCLEQDSDIEILEEKPADCSQGNRETPPKSSGKIRNEKKGNDSGRSDSNRESDQNNDRDQNDITGTWEREDREEHQSHELKTQKCSERIATRFNTISTTREMKVSRRTGWPQTFGKSTTFSSSSRWPQERDDMHRSSSLMAHTSKRNHPSSKGGDSEAEKVWRYQDCAGMIRGPFSMFQLRKWEKTGLFPLGLRIWKIFQQQDDSILLTDALTGRFYHTERENKSNQTCLLRKTAINVSHSGFEQRRNKMPNLKCSESDDLSPKFNEKVGTSSNVSMEPSSNASESKTESEDWSLRFDNRN